jgi:26S proteasome regulatory subunit N1
VPEPEDTHILKIVLELYRKVKQWPDALRTAMRLNNVDTVKEIFTQCDEPAVKKQLAFMLGRQHLFLEDDEFNDIISNSSLSEYFLALGQDLDIMEAKTPEDIYKSNLSDTRGFAANVDSARQNLASTFVNAFVNAGFGQDKLVLTEEGNKWLYKNKEHGMMSAAASLGMILLWDVDGGLSQIDKYLYANEDYIKAGALLAVGVVNAGVKNDCDPALALLSDYLDKPSPMMRVGAILGLGLAYAGSARADLQDLLMPKLEDSSASIEVVATAGLALGFIFVGSANNEIAQAIIAALMEKDEASLNNTQSRYLCLGLGLLYLGKQELVDVYLETLKTIEHPIGKYASFTVETCAYVGTGNVLKVQKLLDVAGDHLEDKNSHQGVAVLGIAMIAMGEEIGGDMAIRAADHILQYGEPVVRRAVPLALGLLSISNPRVTVMDTLSKLSHDSDEEVALGAIFALGLIGAGTNNSRVANMLRGLATYYYKEPNQLFMVRIAQGLIFLGKGTLTVAPYHSDRAILSPTAMAGILTVLHSCLDFKNTILGKSHYMLFCIVSALYPRMLMTFDENLKPVPIPVRVGQAVDTVGQAGRPKTITGFQTHNTPVLLGYGDRAELATDEFIPLTSVLEGFVILKKNPDYKPIEEKPKK